MSQRCSLATSIGSVLALAAAVRDGDLSPEQREHLVSLLYSLGTAATLAPWAQQHYPDNAAALGYLIVTWAPVERDFAELAATVCRDGEGTPRSLSGYPFAEVQRPGVAFRGIGGGFLPRRWSGVRWILMMRGRLVSGCGGSVRAGVSHWWWSRG